MDVREIRQIVESRRQDYLEVLFRLLRQPSISAQNIGVDQCAHLVADVLQENGITSRIMPTDGHPVVYGEYLSKDATSTVLVYGHYDVQPPEPFDAWHSRPFEPEIRDGHIYARGVGDNKGQFLAHILAFKLLSDQGQLPPLNVKFLLEGEEESGSPNLAPFIEQNRELLKADVLYAADGPMHPSNRPVVFFGMRGMLAMELVARGPNRDLHSGNFGGPVPNPVWKLVDLLSTMRFSDGRVAIEGFYDSVLEPSEFERELLEKIPFDADAVRADLEIDEFAGPDDLPYYEKIMFKPTLNITGISSGYAGQGKKSIVPSEAILKLECRLAANQTPDEVYAKIERHVQRYAPDVSIRQLNGTLPSKTSPDLPVSRSIMAAIEEAYGKPPVVMPVLGASSPNFLFTDVLELPSIWTTYANADENNHSPNENMSVEHFLNGIIATACVYQHLAEAGDRV